MIFTNRVAALIADGSVRAVYRRWATARVRPGTLIHTSAGIVRIDAVDRLDTADLTDTDARAAGETSLASLLATFRGTDSDPVFRIGVAYHGADPRGPLGERTDLSDTEIDDLRSRLHGFDRRADHPWTLATLRGIGVNPGMRAVDLADLLGEPDKDRLKLRIRRLKNLGLTRSHPTGYALSPRGRTYLEHEQPTG
ncbi:ASCH domain-containing protein [Nocardia thraciensis]